MVFINIFTSFAWCKNFNDLFVEEGNSANHVKNYSSSTLINSLPVDHKLKDVKNVNIYAITGNNILEDKELTDSKYKIIYLNKNNTLVEEVKSLVRQGIAHIYDLAKKENWKDNHSTANKFKFSKYDGLSRFIFMNGSILSLIREQFKANDANAANIKILNDFDGFFDFCIPLYLVQNKLGEGDGEKCKVFKLFFTYEVNGKKYISSMLTVQEKLVDFSITSRKVYKGKTAMIFVWITVATAFLLFISLLIYYVYINMHGQKLELKKSFIDDYYKNKEGTVDYVDDAVKYTDDKTEDKAKKIEEIKKKLKEEDDKKREEAKRLEEEERKLQQRC